MHVSSSTSKRWYHRIWLPWIVGVLLLGVVVAISESLAKREFSHQRQLKYEAGNTLLLQIYGIMQTQISALERIASRWAQRGGTPETEFRADALRYLHDMSGLLIVEWVDLTDTERWVVSQKGHEMAAAINVPSHPVRQATFEQVQANPMIQVSDPFYLAPGEPGLLIYIPIVEHGLVSGFIIATFDLRRLLNGLFANPSMVQYQTMEGLSVWVGAERVFGQGGDSATIFDSVNLPASDLPVAFRFDSVGQPDRGFLPNLVLAFGIFLSLLVAFILRQLNVVNGALEEVKRARQLTDIQQEARRKIEVEREKGQQRSHLQRDAIASLAVDEALLTGKRAQACARLTEVLSQVIQVDRASIWLFSDDGNTFECIALFDVQTGASEGLTLSVDQFPRYFAALRNDSRIDARDALTDPRTNEFAESYLKPLNISAMLDACVVNDGKAIGVVCLEHRGAIRDWTPDEESFASLVASLVAQVLLNGDRKRAQEDLFKTNQWLEQLLDAASQVSIIATDSAGLITFFNKGAENMLGYKAEEMVGIQTPAMIHLTSEVIARGQELSGELGVPIEGFEVFVARARSGGYEEREWTYVRKDSSQLSVSLTVTAVRNASGEVEGLLGFAIDVSEKNRSQRALEIRNKELAVANLQAQELVATADRANQAKSEFLASMSHEIRTPLNGVLGMLHLIGRQPMTESQQHYLSLASSSARGLLSIISDILDFSKISARKLDLEIMDFDLPELLGDIGESMALRAQEKDVELVLDLSQVSTDWVRGDPNRIRQVVTNLLSNAIKFTEQGEVVLSVKLHVNGADYALSATVSDTGLGMTEEHLTRLFSPFSQGDASTTRRFGGTGLGLVICKQLCELMEGTISVESRLGRGSQFTFTARLQAPEIDFFPPNDQEWLGSRVLVVDQSAASLGALQAQLQAWGLVVWAAQNLPHAISLTAQMSPNMLLLDMRLCGDGYAEILRLAHERKFAVVLMTSIAYHGGLPEGCQGYFRRPATRNDLRRTLSLLHADAPTSVSPGQRLAIDRTRAENRAKSAHILLVEDNFINQQVAEGLLNELGHQVTIAENGEVAIKLLRASAFDFDLILMDCQMPVMDGFEATRLIRAMSGSMSLTPIIAMTANAMTGDRDLCLAAGMSDYIPKPVDPDLLVTKVQHWLNGLVDKIPMGQGESVMTTDSSKELKVWDKAAALGRVRGKPERLAMLIDLFLQDMPERMERLEITFTHSNWVEVKELGHLIKGVAGNLGADKLAHTAQQLERAAEGETADAEQVHLALTSVTNAFSEFVAQLRQYQAENT